MKFRKANINDLDITFCWANDPLVRAFSYQQDEIKFKEHEAWFEKKIGEGDSEFLIFEVEEIPVGLVRMDNLGANWVVGISIDKKARGKGYAPAMLKSASEYVNSIENQPIWAYIKKENIASIKSFIRAGFKKEKELVYQGIESYLYICK
ncbi:MAG: GNAT family N-acetyltransferase [Flammeovirgaceae bacterium]|nr:GNAT family N-acetyltransferase [Flammeovirgaceae bacterium]